MLFAELCGGLVQRLVEIVDIVYCIYVIQTYLSANLFVYIGSSPVIVNSDLL